MAIFKFLVVETRSYECEYEVEADTADEACSLAEIGDTVHEYVDNGSMEVMNREVVHLIDDEEVTS